MSRTGRATDIQSTSNPLEMTEIKATHFQNVSGSKNYPSVFQAIKNALNELLDITMDNSYK